MLRVTRRIALASLLVAAPALANGRFPETNQLVVEPGNPDHAVVRATFGLLVTRDRGATWGFVCEEAFGPQNTDPPLAVLPGGVIVLGLDRGVAASDARGCSFELARDIEGPVADVTASLGEPGTVFALTVDANGARVWSSLDSGVTFEQTASIAELSAVTLDVAPSDPDLLYLSGVEGDTGVLYRSLDRGESFERFEIPGASGSKVPYIAAVDPTDSDTLYVRTYGIPGALLQTRDGGRSFTRRAFEMRTPVQGFALSADGSVLVASNPFDGTFRAERDSFEFERVRCGGASCLAFAEQHLLGCGSESLDGFILGVSRDLGASFSRLLAQSCIPGLVACDEASGVTAACTATWPELRARLGAERCEPVDVMPDSACFHAGGSGGDEAAPPSAAGSGGGGTAASPPSGAAEQGAGSGCGCRLAAERQGLGPALALLALAVSGAARQRARRARS